MQIKNRLFPYPVLTPDNDDFPDNQFDVKIDNVEIKEIDSDLKVITHLNIELNNHDILNNLGVLYDLVIHYECPSTLFRGIVKVQPGNQTVILRSSSINRYLDICCFIIAKQDINNYKLDDFNEDYGNVSFRIEEGNILGYVNVDRIYIDKDDNDTHKTSSIFSVIKIDDEKAPFNVNLDYDKIHLEMSETDYLNFKMLQNGNNLPILHGITIFPALVYAFEQIADSGDQYEDKLWYRALDLQVLKIYEKHIHELEEINSIAIAQALLKHPISRALDNLANEGDDD